MAAVLLVLVLVLVVVLVIGQDHPGVYVAAGFIGLVVFGVLVASGCITLDMLQMAKSLQSLP